MNKVYIGTSGWMYKDWGPKFYPEGMKKGFLTFLASQFDTVEVNTSFYHLPLPTTFENWAGEVPQEFVFALKISRYITHRNHESVKQPAYRFFTRAKRLQDKLGPILVQLPPYRKFVRQFAEKLLDDLLSAAKRAKIEPKLALEPRHRSWLEQIDDVRELVREREVALVFPHSAKIPSIPAIEENLTSNFAYIRFHGPSEFAASAYGASRLRPWAKKIRAWSKDRTVYCYFNNDVHGHAVDDARVLKKLLSS